MIAFLTGTVAERGGASIVLEVHDVGYRLSVPESTLRTCAVGERLTLHVHYHQRDEAPELYGFQTKEELSLFSKLISVSGVGPKTALAALSVASPDGIAGAIARGDAGLLRTVSGIGSKTAERIVVELRDALAREMVAHANGREGSDVDLIEALVGLGYSPLDAQRALRSIPPECTDVSDRLKAALKGLGR
ncbi:MAG: Holliday junction branch migration protein RuvA [Patescibacteria group bacterium]